MCSSLQFFQKSTSSAKVFAFLIVLFLGLVLTLISGFYNPVIALPQLQNTAQSLNGKPPNHLKTKEGLEQIKQGAQSYLQNLQNNVQIMDLYLKKYETQLKEANALFSSLEIKLAQERKIYQPKLAATIARLRFLQRQSLGNQGWELFLESKSFNDFFDRRFKLKRIYEADRRKLTELQKVAKAIKKHQEKLEGQKEQITNLQQQFLEQKADLQAQVVLQTQLLNQVEGDRQALEVTIKRLTEDSQSIRAFIQERAKASDTIDAVDRGTFLLPNSGEITSVFGWRIHPILKSKRLHTGIDFKGNYGSPIIASQSGQVLFAGWYGGYGKTVIIDSGGSLTELYAHANRLYVKEGQFVEQGSTIAEIGATGFATGPHLHFEIRKQGNPIDPLPYLKS